MKKVKQKKALLLTLGDPSKSPRPLRAVQLLQKMNYHITVLGLEPESSISINSLYPLKKPSLSLRGKVFRKILGFLTFIVPIYTFGVFIDSVRYGFNNAVKKLKSDHFDLYLVEGLPLLSVAIKHKLNNDGKIILDAREYYPKEHDNDLWFRLIEKPVIVRRCKVLLKQCDLIFTVSEGLRDEYRKEYSVNPVVYRSTPNYFVTPIITTNFDKVRIVYHGLAHKDRKLELLIDIFKLLDDRFNLDLILLGNISYQNLLKKIAEPYAKIRFPEPVNYNTIINTLTGYDIGLIYYESSDFNVKHCLPNKFFEYIQARLMLAIGPSPDMAQLVRHYSCGIISEEFSVSAMAEALNKLTAEDISYHKSQSDLAAHNLCFEQESKIFISEVDKLEDRCFNMEVHS